MWETEVSGTGGREWNIATKEMAGYALSELEPVAKYIYERYMELPTGKDHKEEVINNRIDSAIQKVSKLT